MVVVATTPDGVAAVGARLAQLGAPTAEILEPSADRRLALAAVEDECEAERLLATLRGEGQLVVARPDGGVRLEAWVQHTRPLIFGDRITVCFAWSEHDRGDLPAVIELGAGGFGNGEHPATRLVSASTSKPGSCAAAITTRSRRATSCAASLTLLQTWLGITTAPC